MLYSNCTLLQSLFDCNDYLTNVGKKGTGKKGTGKKGTGKKGTGKNSTGKMGTEKWVQKKGHT